MKDIDDALSEINSEIASHIDVLMPLSRTSASLSSAVCNNFLFPVSCFQFYFLSQFLTYLCSHMTNQVTLSCKNHKTTFTVRVFSIVTFLQMEYVQRSF